MFEWSIQFRISWFKNHKFTQMIFLIYVVMVIICLYFLSVFHSVTFPVLSNTLSFLDINVDHVDPFISRHLMFSTSSLVIRSPTLTYCPITLQHCTHITNILIDMVTVSHCFYDYWYGHQLQRLFRPDDKRGDWLSYNVRALNW